MVIKKTSTVHEAVHALKQELEFRAEARRNRLLAAWAAERFGLDGDAVDAYVKEVIASDLEEPGDADVVRKVLADFADNGLDMDEAALKEQMEAMMEEARAQVLAEEEAKAD
ncbi:MAG: DUF1476 domain-containing protein [Rhodospirillales bacterium]|jgi:hypothetical protein|nr:DUF1476 domain-containing protein [Rhodospirillales bacterium]MDP6841514.1 DUF1476 domain-containing protein [Rhodospirillales bacterium]